MTTLTNEALKPCPFCGNHGVGPAFVCEAGQWDIWQVECGFCDISIESGTGHAGDAAKQAAITAWNTRLEAASAPMSPAFDLLEGLKLAWRKVDPAKGNNIAAGFARDTGGIDVDYLIEVLGPSGVVEAGRVLLAKLDETLPTADRKPTIAELEKILAAGNSGSIEIKPDGSIYVAPRAEIEAFRAAFSAAPMLIDEGVVEALRSIANSACCEGCNEAKLVAQAALNAHLPVEPAKDLGALSGSREPGLAARPGPSGFDPERWEELADAYKAQSGKPFHWSDCATSIAPAMEPGPCDCPSPWLPMYSAPRDGTEILVAGGTFNRDGDCFDMDYPLTGVAIAHFYTGAWRGEQQAHDEHVWHKPAYWQPLPEVPAIGRQRSAVAQR